ncbi:MAG: hypothetical protein SNJ33_00575 [Rikenellaceae bacterium]
MTLDFFYNWYIFAKRKRGIPFERVVINGIHRDFIKMIANLSLTRSYRKSSGDSQYALAPSDKSSGRIVVSLTTIPSRIKRLWLVVETILRQSQKPDIIVLWLSKEQFADLSTLPKELLAQQSRGLKIELREGNVKVHTKYHYALAEYADDIVITVDDDIFYRSDMISTLMEYHRANPGAVIANRARPLMFNSEGELLPYNDWPMSQEGASQINMQTGVGGVLYPPRVLYKDILNIDLALKLAPFADDLWLFVMARLANCPVVCTDLMRIMIDVPNMGGEKLMKMNVKESRNDIQIRALRDYYMNELGIDPFAK